MRPPRFDPPPAQPIMMSGQRHIFERRACFEDRLPTDAAARWFSTRCPVRSGSSACVPVFDRLGDPCSQASRRFPGFFGEILRPAFVVSDGEGITLPPPYVSIKWRKRYGFAHMRNLDHIHLAGQGRKYAHAMERRAPLTGASLGRHALKTLLFRA